MNTPNYNNTSSVVCAKDKLCLVQRDIWNSRPLLAKLHVQKLPIHRVIISHTAGRSCDAQSICSRVVLYIQEFHMNSLGRNDIGYNFLISSDGSIYVGRGWDYVGEHTEGFNNDSVGIAFIGTFTATEPSDAQVNACSLLLEDGVRLKKLEATYRLYGARQLVATESPGDALYRVIRKWRHWSPKNQR